MSCSGKVYVFEDSDCWPLNNLKQFARPEEWLNLRLDMVSRLACIIQRKEEGALSIAPLLANCPNVEELSVSVVVRYISFNSFNVLVPFLRYNDDNANGVIACCYSHRRATGEGATATELSMVLWVVKGGL